MEDKTLKIARDRIQLEIGEQRRSLAREINAIRANAAATGTLGSGALHLQIAAVCASAAESRGDFVWRILHRSVTTTGVRFSEDLEAKLKGLVSEFLPEDLPDIKGCAVEYVTAQNIRPSLINIVELGRRIGLNRAYNEIELFVASLESRVNLARDSAPSSILIQNYGVVGAIQTGSNATAYTTQHLDAGTKEDIASALNKLATALPTIEGLGLPRGEVIEIVADARAEVAKPEPNKSKLRGQLETISTAIKSVKDLGDVYEMLKPALRFFGLDV